MILDPRIEASTLFITELQLCNVYLQNEVRFPWVVLVPKVEDAKEIIDLGEEDQKQLMSEIAFVSHVMKQIFVPDKLNIGALGNIVSQLHVHVIARYTDDLAWPGPVWGCFDESAPYSRDVASRRVDQLAKLLTL